MGFLENMQKDQQQYDKNIADSVYEESRRFLRKKNGLTHVISFYILGDRVFIKQTVCEGRITDRANQILLAMQKDDYEILDVKLTPVFEASDKRGDNTTYLLTVTYK